IYTRAMQPQLAVVMAAFFNFFGVLLGGLSVAYAIVHMLPTDLLLNMGSTHGLAMVFSMLLAAIIWNLGTWFFGLPASSSHTLIGAIIGIGLTNALLTGSSVMDALNLREVTKIFSSLIIYTRAMQPQLAVVMAAFFNFFGVLLGGLSVAY
ncbi:inorganic phosphate transporter, partial [Staphylococcus aureus]|uniref:inorganic phosphate transporter n=1 Tax=Staphylococcus aureus TaxID=1280 RepID=UPI003D16A126